MTALFIITAILLCVSLFYNWYFWRLAKLYRAAYMREVRGAMAERIGIVVGSLFAALVVRFFSNREDSQ